MKQSTDKALSAALRDHRFAGVLMDSPGAKVEVFDSQEEASAFQSRAVACNLPVMLIEALNLFSVPPLRDFLIEVRNADQFVAVVALLRAAKREGLTVEPQGLVTVSGEIFIRIRAAPTGAKFLRAALKAAGVPGFYPKEYLAVIFSARDANIFAEMIVQVCAGDEEAVAALLTVSADDTPAFRRAFRQIFL